jgi:hypothetical protein
LPADSVKFRARTRGYSQGRRPAADGQLAHQPRARVRPSASGGAERDAKVLGHFEFVMPEKKRNTDLCGAHRRPRGG